ncbi:hypothetical protein EXIGLDRAFT_320914 [Exidia glandulosa HHB12029]|uniref:DUF6533 domain-containing protein n=1 Tax=Exidia glandulosa HHB12029 TaxID=1314781 RepID=A0A165Q5Y9_EXIGL|nr:hypothetical protein EXIGLDRAFT_320914 [Exidia glandulosa HHB12029]
MGYDLDKLGLPRESAVIYAARTNSQYMRLAGFSWLLWDILVNLGTEVRCIWAGRTWSTPVTLYLLARYLPLFSQLFLVYVTFVPSSTALCRAGFSVDAVSRMYPQTPTDSSSSMILPLAEFVTTLCTHCILMYRLYALYDNVKVLVSMVAWTGVNTTATLVLVLWTQSRIIGAQNFVLAVPG